MGLRSISSATNQETGGNGWSRFVPALPVSRAESVGTQPQVVAFFLQHESLGLMMFESKLSSLLSVQVNSG